MKHKYFTQICRAISFSEGQNMGVFEHFLEDLLWYILHFPQTDNK